MKTLITGAPGWLGDRLARSLLERGRKIRCLVFPGSDKNHLERLGIETVIADITQPKTLQSVCEGIGTIIHCAGIIHPRRVSDFYKVNTSGTQNLLMEAIRHKVGKFVYVSSNCAGIGDSVPKVATEDDPPSPFMHYGLSKLRAENILNQNNHEGKIKTIIIRPNWLYGMDGPSRQIRFLRMVKKGKVIVFGHGRMRHSLCDINNCVQSILLAEQSDKAVGKTYYVADEKPYNIREIFDILSNLLDTKIVIQHIRFPYASSILYKFTDRFMQGVRHYRPEIHIGWEWAKNLQCSIKKAREDLGYNPDENFSTGMLKAIKGYRQKGINI